MRAPIKSYRDIDAWKSGMDLYDVSEGIAARLPRYELFGLASQIRRASLSIPANIAEGHGSFYLGKYIAALSVAYSELMELETLGEAAIRRGYVSREEMQRFYGLCGEVGRLINALAKSLQRRQAKLGRHADEYQGRRLQRDTAAEETGD